MERQAKDGTYYRQVGFEEWEPILRKSKDGVVFRKIGPDDWEPLKSKPEKYNSQLASGIRAFNQGATAGFGDEIAGGVEAFGRTIGVQGLGAGDISDAKMHHEGPTLDPSKIKEAYVSGRDKERSLIEQDNAQNPNVTGPAYLAGAFASPINKATQGMSIAKGAAAYGAAAAVGESEQSDPVGLTYDAAAGGLVGFTLGKGGEIVFPAVGKALGYLGKPVRNAANKLAAKATGAERGSINKMGVDKSREAGSYALENNIFGPFSSTETMAARNKALQDKAGKEMGKVYDKVDEAGQSTFNPKDVARKVDDELGDFYRAPINKAETNQFDNTLETILLRMDNADKNGNIPLKEAQKLKEQLNGAANWNNNINISDKERMARSAAKIVSDAIDDAVESGVPKLDSAKLLERFRQAKSDYGNTKKIDTFIKNQLAKEEGNNSTIGGLADVLTFGGSWAYTEDPQKAFAIAAARRYLGAFGTQQAARTFYRLSQAVNMPSTVAKALGENPKAMNSFISMFTDKSLDLSKQMKGEKKWAVSGFSNIIKEDPQMAAKAGELFSSKKGQKLLIEASNAKPGSKRMKAILKKLEGMKQ